MPEPGVLDPLTPGGRPGAGNGAAKLTSLSIERLEPLLTGTRFAGRGRVLESVASTNDVLHDLARSGAPPGTYVLAGEQTGGRGRRRRSWVSAAGQGLYLSVLFRPPPGPPTRWTLGAAVAACDACRDAGADVWIKWPNDLLVGPDKLGGILVETRSAGTAVDELIVGLGVNVHHDEAEIAAIGVPDVTSLRRAVPSGMVGSRTELAGAFLGRLDGIATALEDGDWSTVAAAWAQRAPRAIGAPVTVAGAGGAVWSGTSAGLAEDGALRVRDADGRLQTVRQIDSVRFTEG